MLCYLLAAFKEVVPAWVYTVKIPPEYAADKLGGCSDGMNMVGPNTVQRTRVGHFDTDAAKWSRGFTSGQSARKGRGRGGEGGREGREKEEERERERGKSLRE